MGKYKPEPRYTVISMRVSDDEKEQIDTLRQQKSISNFAREALRHYLLTMKMN
ncbi:ribbon-helix-helix protein, CopG family [Trichlorobacter lovleyi]|jgi:predicted transcriptional regulator|uniref:ribbon-helix-helix protein, CopG family n=1 Tax=Trichlorobacter lovleyi TaxID=313985 RepID=UPI0023F06F05|nr:ribbon-helix-helix protein, CopG family [Trichlorobacter lovleyi]